MGLVNDVFDRRPPRPPRGRPGDGPRPLLHGGRHRGRQRPAHPHRVSPRARSPSATTATWSTPHPAPQELEAAGSIFQSTSDTEVILHLYARSHRERLEDAIAASLSKVMGAFSLLFLTQDALVAARDPWGFRPLVIGRLEGATIVARRPAPWTSSTPSTSGTSSPGELVVVDRTGMRSFRPFPPEPARQCVFEHVYFARPDSQVFGRNVLESRLLLGRQLAREAPAEPTSSCRSPTAAWAPPSATPRESGLPFAVGAHPKPLRGPNLHRAEAIHPLLRRQDQAESGPERPRGQTRGPDRRLDRARARRRGRSWGWCGAAGAARGPHADQQPPHHRPLLLRHRYAASRASSSPRDTRSRRSGSTSAPTAWATCPTRACSGPWTTRAGSAALHGLLLGPIPVAVAQPDEWQLRLFEKARA